jgi:hypothetical protein
MIEFIFVFSAHSEESIAFSVLKDGSNQLRHPGRLGCPAFGQRFPTARFRFSVSILFLRLGPSAQLAFLLESQWPPPLPPLGPLTYRRV